MGFFISCQILDNKAWSPVSKKNDWVEGTFTFSFLSMIIHKIISQYWIVKDVKDGVSCISYWQAGLGIVQCCNIVPSLVSSIEKKLENWAFLLSRNFPTGWGAHPWWGVLPFGPNLNFGSFLRFSDMCMKNSRMHQKYGWSGWRGRYKDLQKTERSCSLLILQLSDYQ